MKLLKFDLAGLEPEFPFAEGEEIKKIDFGRIDPYLDYPHSILCLMLQTEKDSVVTNLKIYSLSSSSIPPYRIYYSPSSTWIGGLTYDDMISSSSEIPAHLPGSQNLFHISGSSILSGSSFSGSSQWIHLMLTLDQDKYPFGVYDDIQLNFDYDIIS